MGLFTKELCCICDNKAGLLDKKCKDGKVCKECRGKLSIWFDDYKESSKYDLISQISHKTLDKANALDMNFNKIYGESGVIAIDEAARKVVVLPDTGEGLFRNRKDVKSTLDVVKLSPDLVDFDQIKDIEIDINELSHEEKRTENGQQVSYDPPHYVYMYTFTLRFIVDHPYIKRMYAILNSDSVKIPSIGRRVWTDPGKRLAAHLLGLPRLITEDREAIYQDESLFANLMRSQYEMPVMSYGFKCTADNYRGLQRYMYYLAMAREIKETIMGADDTL